MLKKKPKIIYFSTIYSSQHHDEPDQDTGQEEAAEEEVEVEQMSVLNDDLLLRLETERPDVGLVGRIVQLESGVLTGCGRRSVTAIFPCGAVVSNSRVAVAVRAGEVGSARRSSVISECGLSVSARRVHSVCCTHLVLVSAQDGQIVALQST